MNTKKVKLPVVIQFGNKYNTTECVKKSSNNL